MLPARLRRLIADQSGVVARRQVLTAGLDDNDIERLLRRRQWARVHPGVYVDHTGPLTHAQRQWAAVLHFWPACLYGVSALEAFGARIGRRDLQDECIHVAIEHPRKAAPVDGVRLHRVVGLAERAAWNLGPPRLRLEEAAIVAAAEAPTADAALALAADLCQQRRTTPQRLLARLTGRRVRHGAWLRAVLLDVAEGTLSLLEHGYLTRVERPHGLPRPTRQVSGTDASGAVYRDVEYDDFGIITELDGRLGHEWTAERWDDMDRDLAAGGEGTFTIRLGWRQVMGTPCQTAEGMGRVLQRRGWAGHPVPCAPGCAVGGSPGRSPAPVADDRPA